MRSKLFIVILNFNSGKRILDCVESLIKDVETRKDILVVDNNSSDDSLWLLERFRRKISIRLSIIRNKKNFGYASGNNIGISFALDRGVRYVLLLNPDMVLSHGSLSTLIAHCESKPNIGIVGPKIYILGTPNKIWSCGGIIDKERYTAGLIGYREVDSGHYKNKKEVDYVSGAGMLVRREVFNKVGSFFPYYFLYYEDVELCLRARLMGFKVVFEPSVIFNHDFSSSVGRYSPLKQYYMARNHLLFVERNAPRRVLIREFLRLPKTVLEHCLRGDLYSLLGVSDYFLRRFGKNDHWR